MYYHSVKWVAPTFKYTTILKVVDILHMYIVCMYIEVIVWILVVLVVCSVHNNRFTLEERLHQSYHLILSATIINVINLRPTLQ